MLSNSKGMRKTKIRITGIYSDIPVTMYLRNFLLLRRCEKVGDVETVNNYQLGLLNESKAHGQIDFEKVTE